MWLQAPAAFSTDVVTVIGKMTDSSGCGLIMVNKTAVVKSNLSSFFFLQCGDLFFIVSLTTTSICYRCQYISHLKELLKAGMQKYAEVSKLEVNLLLK